MEIETENNWFRMSEVAVTGNLSAEFEKFFWTLGIFLDILNLFRIKTIKERLLTGLNKNERTEWMERIFLMKEINTNWYGK